MRSFNRALLVDNLRRLVPQPTGPGLPALAPATPISQAEGVGLVAQASPSGRGGGASLGSAQPSTLTSSDGIFTWSGTARPIAASNGSTVLVPIVG